MSFEVMSSIPALICVALFLSFNFGYVFFFSLLMLCVVHAETLTKGSLLPHQERRFLWCYCVQLRNRNAISHVLKLFGLFLTVRGADVFSHLFRASILSFSESSVLRDSHSRAALVASRFDGTQNNPKQI